MKFQNGPKDSRSSKKVERTLTTLIFIKNQECSRWWDGFLKRLDMTG